MCTLNPTAVEVWELCDGSRTREQIASAFADLYPGQAREALLQDARELLGLLEQYGLVKAEAGTDGCVDGQCDR